MFTDRIIRILAASALALPLWGCTEIERVEYTRFSDMDSGIWVRDRWLGFEPVPADSAGFRAQRHELVLALRHDDSMPYRRLRIAVAYSDPDSGFSTDTVSIELCDDSGRWLGSGRRGIYEIRHTLRRDFAVPPGFKVELAHVMECDTLEGVNNIGIILLNNE